MRQFIKSAFVRSVLLVVGLMTGGIGFAFSPNDTFTTTDGWTFTFRGSDDVIGMRDTASNGVRYLVGAVSLDGYSGEPKENLVMPSYVRFQSATYDCYGIVRSTYVRRKGMVPSLGNRNYYNTFDFSVTTNLVLPSTCRNIGEGSLAAASNVVSITFPTSLESIGFGTCYNCRKLKSVSLTSPYLKSIGYSSFAGCSSLESVFIEGNGKTVITDSAFHGCSSLKSVEFGPGVKRVGEQYGSNSNRYGVFENCYKLSEIDFGGVTFIDTHTFIGAGRDVPGTLDIDFGITAITNVASGAFSKMYALKSIRFPETIGQKDIVFDHSAFSSCTNLVDAVNVPVNGNSYSMFRDCTSLSNVVIATNSPEIGSTTFANCVSLEHVVIPNTVTNIDSAAFSGCSALREIILPASVATIGSSAFSGCSSLKEMILPASLATIGDSAFNNCRSLGRVEIWADAPDFGNYPFLYCTSLTNVVFRGNVAPKKRINASSSSEMFSLTPTDLVVLVKAGSKGWTGDESSDEIPSQWTLSDYPKDPKRRISFIPVAVTFSPLGGTATGVIDSYVPRTEFGASLPTASWDGHVFLGWFTTEVGGEQITANSRVPDDSATYYAHWGEPTASSVYMTFDANGGSVSPSNAWYEIGEPFGTLPYPVFANRTFAGWFYVTAEEERFVDPKMAVPADVTLLQAKWLDGVWETLVTNGVVSVWMPSNNVPVRISRDWFDQKGVAPFLGRVGGDYGAALRLPTGKFDGAGRSLTVLDDYIMGTDPLNADDVLKVVIDMNSEGKLHVGWYPNLNADGEVRVYKVWGISRLNDADEEWMCPTNATHRFFKVTVEMP